MSVDMNKAEEAAKGLIKALEETGANLTAGQQSMIQHSVGIAYIDGRMDGLNWEPDDGNKNYHYQPSQSVPFHIYLWLFGLTMVSIGAYLMALSS